MHNNGTNASPAILKANFACPETQNQLLKQILVIGYGNDLRGDDAVGKRVADAIATWQIPYVQTLTVHQLTPELAESLAGVNVAIFVDAYPVSANPEVQVLSLEPAETGISMGHWCEPQVLLALTQALYGSHPQAWWVTVPGVNFAIGNDLSSVATLGIETALEHIAPLIKTKRIKPCMKLA